MADFESSFLFHWCDMYGLSLDTATCLRDDGIRCGNDLYQMNPQKVNDLDLPLSQKCLLRGALLQYRGARSRTDREIAKARGKPDVPATSRTPRLSGDAGHVAHSQHSSDALVKMKKVVHRLNQIESDVTIGNSLEADIIRELRRRLHKKRDTGARADGLTLAQRILLKRTQPMQEPPAEEGDRCNSAPPTKENRCTSVRSLTSVQSSPACPQFSGEDPATQLPPVEVTSIAAPPPPPPAAKDTQQRAPPHKHKKRDKTRAQKKPSKPKEEEEEEEAPTKVARAGDEERQLEEYDKDLSDVLAEIDSIGTASRSHKPLGKHEGELQKRESKQKMEEAVRMLDELFDEEELALIAAINKEKDQHRLKPKKGKTHSVIKDEDLDKMINGDFNQALDEFLTKKEFTSAS